MWLRDFFLKDAGLKVFSLALAILIWLTVSFAIRKGSRQEANVFSNIPSRVLRVPVLVMSAAANVREFRVRPNYVEVTVRGEQAALAKLQERDIHAIVDLTGIESTEGMSKRIEVSTPPGIVHVGVYPEDVEIVIPHRNDVQFVPPQIPIIVPTNP